MKDGKNPVTLKFIQDLTRLGLNHGFDSYEYRKVVAMVFKDEIADMDFKDLTNHISKFEYDSEKDSCLITFEFEANVDMADVEKIAKGEL